jgi:cytochrome b subunit of formate dehydrogenase/nitrate/TMAO reductase-like tetraheme cytochrome c subunit
MKMRRAGRTNLYRLCLAVVWLCFCPAVEMFAQPADCLSCHEDQKTAMAPSAHATVACTACHTKHQDYPHPEKLPKPECVSCHAAQVGEHSRSVHGTQLASGNTAAPGCDTCHDTAHTTKKTKSAEFHKSVPENCGMCHGDVLTEYQASVHGKALAAGIPQTPVCTDCHGEHSILRAKEKGSLVSPTAVSDTCGRCHGDLRLTRRFGLPSDRITTFAASFHGLASRTGAQTVANCASCHGFHKILASTDKESTIHPSNLGQTCGNCHPGAGTRFAISPIHVAEDGTEAWQVRYLRQFYLFLIPFVIGLMMLHNAGDLVRKFQALRLQPAVAAGPRPAAAGAGELRMYPWERVQHFLLATSFIVLVWTGFALKYPDHIWARPLVALEEFLPVRGTVHRGAGVVMILVSFLHIATLVFNRQLREHWYEMLPKWRDVTEAWSGFVYNIGLSQKKPKISSHSYIEKAEYWAVVWGTLVMAVTGIMLWANNWMLASMPKVWLDFAVTLHLYEAILATLAIVVWHFYGVIFDPDVYPMDTAWMTGRTVRRHAPHSEEKDSSSDDNPKPGKPV